MFRPQLKEITPEQAELVQTDWSYIKNQSVDILENFFEKHPGNMKKFKVEKNYKFSFKNF